VEVKTLSQSKEYYTIGTDIYQNISLAYFTWGMKAQYGMRTARQSMTRSPVATPPIGVFTPLAAFTAVRLQKRQHGKVNCILFYCKVKVLWRHKYESWMYCCCIPLFFPYFFQYSIVSWLFLNDLCLKTLQLAALLGHVSLISTVRLIKISQDTDDIESRCCFHLCRIFSCQT